MQFFWNKIAQLILKNASTVYFFQACSRFYIFINKIL